MPEDPRNQLEENDDLETLEEEELKVEKNNTSSFTKTFLNASKFILNLFNNRFGRLLLLSFLLFLCAFIFWHSKMTLRNKEGATINFDIKYVFFFLSALILVFLGYSLLLYHGSYFALKHTFTLNSTFYYINELSEHIALGTIFIFLITILLWYKKNYCFENVNGYDIYIGDLLNISLIIIFMFGALKVWTKSISMNFNYQIYMKRILRVLATEVLVSVLKIITNPLRQCGYPHDGLKPIKIPKSTLNDQCGFSGNEILNISIRKAKGKKEMSTRRILLKEFQKFCRNKPVSYELPVDQQRLNKRDMAITGHLHIDLTAKGMKDITCVLPYFTNGNEFNTFCEAASLSTSFPLDHDSLFGLISGISKEKFYLLRNLEQMNEAIDRVGLVCKMLILILGGIMLYIKISEDVTSTATIVSAIFGTQFISHSFSSNAINSMIFLFFIHPYDIGDRVFIKIDNKIENLVVSQLNVFSTVFFRWDGTCVIVPNAVLSEKLICNVRRSGIMGESHKIQINTRTHQNKLNKLKCCIEDFVKSRPDKFTEYILLNYEFIENSNKLHMKVYMQYRENWQDYGAYLKSKTEFVSFLNRTLHALEIDYVLPPQRVILKGASDALPSTMQ